MDEKNISFDIETTGLNAQEHSVTCICAITSDGEEFNQVVVPGTIDEVDVIDNFLEFISVYSNNNYQLISKNGIGFDVPFLMLRAYINCIPLIQANNLLEIDHFDIQSITSRRVGLQQMAELYGLDGKLEKGSFAPTLWANKEYERLSNYCMQDARLTLAIYDKYRLLTNK